MKLINEYEINKKELDCDPVGKNIYYICRKDRNMKMEKQEYPVGVQSFGLLRKSRFVYVDKTQYIKNLVKVPRYIFLSRPRRFGKSLLLSTLEEYFKGNRELFRGLAIDADDVDWTPRPVFTFSFSRFDPKSDDALYQLISNQLMEYEKEYGKEEGITELAPRFENLIKRAFKRNQREVVVLIDEYDTPLLSTFHNEALNESFRETLKSIFTVVKDLNKFIYFEFVTGISRFSHTSLFSGANNLDDISMLEEYSGICGITEKELIDNLMPGIQAFSEAKEISENEALSIFKQNYDGYHFTKKCADIYNPFSLMKALRYNEIGDYWFSSGTPSYLLEVMKEDNFYLPKLDCIEAVESELSATESYAKNPIALLYESGYVTIKDYDEESGIFTLGLPNEEVAVSFSKALMPLYSGYSDTENNDLYVGMRKAVMSGNAKTFMELLQTFLSGNPYGNTELSKRESYFKNNIFLVFKALGFRPHAEEQTCNARIDTMLETRRFIYIFELKVNKTARAALDQINNKGYANPWGNSGKIIIKIGANYNSKTNNIDDWEVEIVNPDILKS